VQLAALLANDTSLGVTANIPASSPAFVTRFAPSPTGLLHLGHAYSALLAFDRARQEKGRFLLRIEDIDLTRCQVSFISAIEQDLAWLGVQWERPVRLQSRHQHDYQKALDQLRRLNLIYPCFCTRSDIAAAVQAPHGPEGLIYPGTCKWMRDPDLVRPHAWRLHVDRAIARFGALAWHDEIAGRVQAEPQSLGDVCIARKDTPTSYHLAVTVDDALQAVTHVIRGADLFHATHIHRLLQACLGLPTPIYHHHRLVTDDQGRRYAKRDRAITLQALREAGETPAQIRERLGLPQDAGAHATI
jgi:glutamyl-Q tRNA(Asp) synthetase